MKEVKKIKFKNKYRVTSCRINSWDYRWPGTYFITINTAGNAFYFGEIENGIMHRSEIGKVAHSFWLEIPMHFPRVKLGKFVVMPNHIHGIITLKNHYPTQDFVNGKEVDIIKKLEPLHATAPVKNHLVSFKMSNLSPRPGSISTIIRSYKSAVSKEIHEMDLNFSWQKKFYDKIINNKFSHLRIEKYIDQNPGNWGKMIF